MAKNKKQKGSRFAQRRAAAAEKPARTNGRARGNIVLGPVTIAKVRVPINEKAYARKESEIAQLELKSRKLRAKIKPDQIELAEHRKQIAVLTEDLDEGSEERDVKVRHEFHYNTNEVRVLRASDQHELERRTMTAAERTRNSDLEDQEVDGRDRPRAEAPGDDDIVEPLPADAQAEDESAGG
jgi:hypothetical protein